MARMPRLLLRGEAATYHVISRSALPGFPLGDAHGLARARTRGR